MIDLKRPDGQHDRQIWDATLERNNDPIGYRYESEQVPLTLAQAIQQWWSGLKNLEWNWSRTGIVLRPIKPGEPGYDVAPYELGILFHKAQK